MKFLETSKIYSLNKSTYINLRWFSYIGQLTVILIVQFFESEFYFPFEFLQNIYHSENIFHPIFFYDLEFIYTFNIAYSEHR